MFRLAIIDDERATRQGLRDMLDWHALDIDIVGEAEDGLAAKGMILELRPDIIICDVRMPKLDGIALVAQIRPLMDNLQIIFLSGHSEKAYLRSAIRFGAVDYLDKPVMKEELIAVLETAKARASEGRRVTPEDAMQGYITQLLTGKAAPDLIAPGKLPVDFEKPYHIALFSFGFRSEQAEGAGLFVQQQLPAFNSLFCQLFDGRAVLHPLGTQYVGYCNPKADVDLSAISKAFSRELPKAWPHTAISLSTLAVGMEALPAAYAQAQEANRSFWGGYGRCYAYDSRFRQEASEHAAAIPQIIEKVEAQQFSQAANLLDGYVGRVRHAPVDDIDAIRKELARLAVFLAKQYRPQDEAYHFAMLEQVKFGCLCLEEIRTVLQDQIGNLVSSLDSLSSKGRVIYDVERYIQANYARELSVADIAGHVYLTPTYLCFLYKKNTGKTLNAYITEVKMEKAKELLKKPALKLGDVAQMLGYNSPNYFARTFTKQFGTTPKAYRNQVL